MALRRGGWHIVWVSFYRKFDDLLTKPSICPTTPLQKNMQEHKNRVPTYYIITTKKLLTKKYSSTLPGTLTSHEICMMNLNFKTRFKDALLMIFIFTIRQDARGSLIIICLALRSRFSRH